MKKIIKIKFNKENVYESSTKDEGIAGSDVLTFKHDDERHFMCKSNSWELCPDDIKSMNVPNLNVTPGSDVDITDKKLYRFPKLHLPRQKVDLLKEKYNLTVIFVSHDLSIVKSVLKSNENRKKIHFSDFSGPRKK